MGVILSANTLQLQAALIIDRLQSATQLLRDWQITVFCHDLPQDGEDNPARVSFDTDAKRAVIWLHPEWPPEQWPLTLEETIAHELGHLILGEQSDNEGAATRIGLLLIEMSKKP